MHIGVLYLDQFKHINTILLNILNILVKNNVNKDNASSMIKFK